LCQWPLTFISWVIDVYLLCCGYQLVHVILLDLTLLTGE